MILSVGFGAFAQSAPAELHLRMPGPSSYVDPSRMIHLQQSDGTVVFRIARDVPTNLEKGNGWQLGPHIPYPIREYDFIVPANLCQDMLNCDSGDQAVNVEEIHISGQHAARKAGIRFVIQNRGNDTYNVDVWMTDPQGNVEAVHESMLEVK